MKKKSTLKPADPKPKYNVGNRLYFISYRSPQRPVIMQGEVSNAKTEKVPLKDATSGKITGTYTYLTYEMDTAFGPWEVDETDLIPSFVEAAKTLAKSYLHLIK